MFEFGFGRMRMGKELLIYLFILLFAHLVMVWGVTCCSSLVNGMRLFGIWNSLSDNVKLIMCV